MLIKSFNPISVVCFFCLHLVLEHNNEWPVCAIVSSQTQSRSESCTLSLTSLERNTVSYKETLWATKKQCELQERRPSVPPGEQELFPDSGMFLSPFRLAAIHQASRQHCLHLFDLLFDHFFLSGRMLIQLPLDAMAKSPRQEGQRNSK